MSIRGVAWKTPPAVVLLFLSWACECAWVGTETASVWEMCGRGDLEAYPGVGSSPGGGGSFPAWLLSCRCAGAGRECGCFLSPLGRLMMSAVRWDDSNRSTRQGKGAAAGTD